MTDDAAFQDQETDEPAPGGDQPGIAGVLREVVVFQFKLLADGFRDVLLSPVSIGAALFGIIANPSDPGLYLRRLMAVGVRTDRWINLFGAHDYESRETSDWVIRQVENRVVDEYRRRAGRQDGKDE